MSSTLHSTQCRINGVGGKGSKTSFWFDSENERKLNFRQSHVPKVKPTNHQLPAVGMRLAFLYAFIPWIHSFPVNQIPDKKKRCRQLVVGNVQCHGWLFLLLLLLWSMFDVEIDFNSYACYVLWMKLNVNAKLFQPLLKPFSSILDRIYNDFPLWIFRL